MCGCGGFIVSGCLLLGLICFVLGANTAQLHCTTLLPCLRPNHREPQIPAPAHHYLRGLRVCKNDVVVAGGMERMSNAPKYLVDATNGSRLGHDTIVDGMAKDGLWDVYNDFGMAICAEICADQHKITREQQVTYCLQG
ncbi:unnamed protein product, partial [Vitis vinifera]|uniref:Thiolase N-terminal domain-containing protein n=1 Tax=Vitis vinifera TaxID=29760 RepID=D7SMY1_VITVI